MIETIEILSFILPGIFPFALVLSVIDYADYSDDRLTHSAAFLSKECIIEIDGLYFIGIKQRILFFSIGWYYNENDSYQTIEEVALKIKKNRVKNRKLIIKEIKEIKQVDNRK